MDDKNKKGQPEGWPKNTNKTGPNDTDRQAEAQRFLSILDPEAEYFCFQTFDDDEERKRAGKTRKDLARTMSGSLSGIWTALDRLNQQGAGVYVTINEVAEGQRRNAENVIRVRAVFGDFDPPKTAAAPARYPLPTVIEVESSPGKRHAYWTVDGLALGDFQCQQRAVIATLGSDPAPCDLPRVMRLPGSFNMKVPATPHLVRIVATDERLPYTPEEIRAVFPPAKNPPSRAIPARPPQSSADDPRAALPDWDDELIRDLRDALTLMDADPYDSWIANGERLAGGGDAGKRIWFEWSATSQKFNAEFAEQKWATFKPTRTGCRAIFAEAQRLGWVNPKRGVLPAAPPPPVPPSPPEPSEQGVGEDLARAVAVLKAAIGRQTEDPHGAPFTPEALAAWGTVAAADPAEFERLRGLAGRGGARKTEIDKAVKRASSGNSKTYFGSDPLDPLGIRVQPSRYPLGSLSEAEGILSEKPPIIPPDALLETNRDGKQFRLIESKAAAKVAAVLAERLAWDGEGGTWQLWQGTHWEPLDVSAKADALLAEAVHVGTLSLGYRVAYLNGVTQVIQRRGLLRPLDRPTGVIPFANGLLDLDTGALTLATPTRALDWCLPHGYDSRADCPTIKAWLLRSVEGDTGTVEFLRAWWAALLRGVPLQSFLMLLGRGKCGKGVFQRLSVTLVGARNTAISTLRDLEENRFETAKLYGKRLCMINESGKHGGALNMLKAITGGDHLPLERKHVQQSGTFVFGGLVLMATNEALESTDSTSGLERRRITVRFPVSATPAEVEDWEAKGGEESVLYPEIPGLIRWLLELSPADIRARIESPPARIVSDNLLGMAAGNSVADWMLSETLPDPDAWRQIGKKDEGRDPSSGKTFFENASSWFYPSYLTWMLREGRVRPVSLRKFRETVIDVAEHLGHPVFFKEHPEKRTRGIQGICFREDNPLGPRASEWVKERIEPAYREDREGDGPNLVPGNSEKEHAPAAIWPEVDL